ncbi:MAG: helicase-exonuclease AddAB subunit AddB [Lachnospiraceae bacterium]|nr:helicase-exonuclease AddAB subunit AddB [Lachnospiraceae bacterium]
MALQFYFGPSGSGKSKKLHQDVLRMAAKDPDCNFLFLVPDQFTMQTQTDLVKESPGGGIMNIDVLSFGRLTHRIFEETGYGRKPVLDDTGKSLVLRKVASSVQEELPVLSKNLNKIGYIHEIKSAISEFKQYGLSVDRVGELAEFAKGRGTLYYKLKDLKTLYQAFDAYVAERFVTTEDTLALLSRAVHESKIMKNSVVIFDGFTGFTPIQYRLIAELMELSRMVIVSVTLGEGENPYQITGEQELFYLSKKTVRDLQKWAQRGNVRQTEDVYLGKGGLPRFRESRELAHLEKQLFRYPLKPYEEPQQDSVPAIQIREAMSPAQEVRGACILIKKLVLEQKYSYRDIAVVTGELATYGDFFEREAATYDIPVFIDRTRGILLNPFLEYIRSALRIVLQNFSYESVFHYLRSGLADFTMEETDLLENYILATGIKGRKKWGELFTRNATEQINELRERLYGQMAPLLQKQETASGYVKALYEFIVAGRIQEKLLTFEEQFRADGEEERAREYAQIYRLVMELLTQIEGLLKEETMTLQEFADILDSGFAEIEVGTIPGGVDRVIVGDMERTRLNQVKVLLFLGVNDGNIPRNANKGGIISDIDREFLKDSDIELAPTPRQQMFTQRLYLYMNMTKPSERLYLSYARISSDGKTLRPSYLIDTMKALFPRAYQGNLQEGKESVTERIMGKKDALPYVAEELRERAQGRAGVMTDEEFFSLCRIYWEDPAFCGQMKKILQAAYEHYEHKPLGAMIARMVYGTVLENSVSRLERYAACAYAHFLQYGLSLKEREVFQLENEDLGNIYHEVLEVFSHRLKEHGYTWLDFPKEEGEQLLWEALENCAMQYGETILYSSARYQYMIQRLYRILKRTIWALKEQLKSGKFLPEAFEMSFSRVENLDAVNITLSEEEKMKLRGRIDRLDTYEDEDHVYVKVIDYKSGNKKFDLAAVYYGLQLQLIVYMNVAAELMKKSHPDKEIVPAALLYYHVNDPMIKSEEELSPEQVNDQLLKELRMNGLVNDSEEVIGLLDGSFATKSSIIPVERKSDGSLSARSSVVNRQDYEVISNYVNQKMHQFGTEILQGNIAVNPCEQGNIESCTYCTFREICAFDGKIPGFEKRKPGHGMDVLKDEQDILEKMRKHSAMQN